MSVDSLKKAEEDIKDLLAETEKELGLSAIKWHRISKIREALLIVFENKNILLMQMLANELRAMTIGTSEYKKKKPIGFNRMG